MPIPQRSDDKAWALCALIAQAAHSKGRPIRRVPNVPALYRLGCSCTESSRRSAATQRVSHSEGVQITALQQSCSSPVRQPGHALTLAQGLGIGVADLMQGGVVHCSVFARESQLGMQAGGHTIAAKGILQDNMMVRDMLPRRVLQQRLACLGVARLLRIRCLLAPCHEAPE